MDSKVPVLTGEEDAGERVIMKFWIRPATGVGSEFPMIADIEIW